MQRLLLEKTELERNLDDIRSDSIRKDREISRLSRSLEEMDKELDLMKNLLHPAHTPVSPSRPRSDTLSKRLSKRLSWLSDRMGVPRLASFSASVEVQPLTDTSSRSLDQRVKMRHARSVDTLDLPSPTRSLKVQWSKKSVAKAPTNRMVRGAALVHNGIVYFSSYLTPIIWGYNSAQEQWFQLADCPNVFFALAMINGCLTAIGGQRSHGGVEPTNELLSLVVGEHQLWVELNAPMPTKRTNATAVTTKEVLVVARRSQHKENGHCRDHDLGNEAVVGCYEPPSPCRIRLVSILPHDGAAVSDGRRRREWTNEIGSDVHHGQAAPLLRSFQQDPGLQ